jgi:hypothetical protein
MSDEGNHEEHEEHEGSFSRPFGVHLTSPLSPQGERVMSETIGAPCASTWKQET